MIKQDVCAFSKLAAAVVLMAGLASTAAAQTPKVELAGGYAYLHETDLSVPKGWFASGGENFNDWFGIVGAVSGHYKSETVSGVKVNVKLHTYVVGPKFASYKNPAFSPYAQVLFGGARVTGGVNVSVPGSSSVNVSSSENGFDFQPGGGVDIKAGNTIAIRVGVNADVIRSSGETSKEFQFIIGVVYRK
jgi:hypothetical protein